MIVCNKKIFYIFKAILFCVVFTLLLIVFSVLGSFFPGGNERLINGIVGSFSGFLTIILFLKYEKESFSAVGLNIERNTIQKFFVGVVVGIMMIGMLAASVLMYTRAIIRLNPQSNVLFFLIGTIPLLPLAWMEELGFRTYPIFILKNKIGVRSSLIITSVLFALYHIANGWSVASSFYGPAVWGLIFGLAAIYAKGIAMPTGLHYAVNLTISAFGEPGNSLSIWTVNYPVPVERGAFDWLTIIPSLALLLFAIGLIELYIRKIKELPGHSIKPSS